MTPSSAIRSLSRSLLLWQIHLLQKRLVARVAIETLKRHFTFEVAETHILLLIRAVKPLEGLIRLAAKRIDLRDVKRVAFCLVFKHLRQCYIGVRLSPQSEISHRGAAEARRLVCLLLHFSERRFRLVTREQHPP